MPSAFRFFIDPDFATPYANSDAAMLLMPTSPAL
jgi:hypothetical protein